MSLSIADLLRAMPDEKKVKESKSAQGKLHNPDIPTRKNGPLKTMHPINLTRPPSALSGEPVSREVVRDRFYNSMKLGSAPRNADGWSLARTPSLQGLNPKRQAFLLEGTIDPAAIRARHNPLRAPPNSYAEGGEDYLYALPPSTGTSRNAVGLIRTARASYAARVNRLQPPSVPVREQDQTRAPTAST